MKLYIDDIRTPSGEFDHILRTSQDAIIFLDTHGCPAYISFDHDLGEESERDADHIVNWMIEKDLNEGKSWIPSDFAFNVHSANPVGVKNITLKLNGYLEFRERCSGEDINMDCSY